MIDELLSAFERGEIEAALRHFQPHLSHETVAALKRRVDELKLKNARAALDVAEVAGHVAGQLGTDPSRALAAWARGNALVHLSRYAEARACYQGAQAVYAQGGAAWEVACLQINQVGLLEEMSEYRAALELAGQARHACTALGDRALPLLAVLEMNEGVAHQQLGDFPAALTAFQRGHAAFLSLENPAQAARMEINQAYVQLELNHHTEAEALLLGARATLEEEGQDQEVARADLQLGILAYRRGHHQAALRRLEQARTCFEAIPNPGDVAVVDLYRSLVYRQLNLLQETINLAAQAERQFDRDHTRWEQAMALINQGVGYRRLEAWVVAERLFGAARKILSRRGVWTRVLELDVERVFLALEEGRGGAAAGRASRDGAVPDLACPQLTARGLVARDFAARMLQEIDPGQHPAQAARLNLLLARNPLQELARARPDDPARPGVMDTARQHVESALALTRELELSEVRVSALHLAGLLLEQRGELEASLNHLWRAIETVERLRALLELDELRVGFMDDKSALYLDAARLSQRVGSAAQLLMALNLVHSIPLPFRGAGSSLESTEDAPLYARLRELREAWHWQQTRLSGARAPEEGRSLRAPTSEPATASASAGGRPDVAEEGENARNRGEAGHPAAQDEDAHVRLRELEAQLAELSRRLQIRSMSGPRAVGVSAGRIDMFSPGRFALNRLDGLLGEQAEAFLSQVQRGLGPDDLLLHFYRLDGEVRVVAVSRLEVRQAPGGTPGERVDRTLRAWRFHLEHAVAGSGVAGSRAGAGTASESSSGAGAGDHPAGTPPPHLSRLYQALLGPLEPWLSGVRRLYVIVPPGWHDVPFAALHDGTSYLVERLELIFLSAPEALLGGAGREGDLEGYPGGGAEAARRAGTEAGSGAGTETGSGAGSEAGSGAGKKARAAGEAGSEVPRALVLGLSDDGRLEHALEEAQAVASALVPRWQVTLALEHQATLATLRAASGACRLIHLATHAVWRPDNPFFSWVQLSDARLTVADLYEMTLPRGPLVVLSACETGRGQPRAGGLLGMGRALLAAGASGLVVSLWKVSDQASARLMSAFYRDLPDATPGVAAAGLRCAQLEALARGEHPFLWAGFIFVQG